MKPEFLMLANVYDPSKIILLGWYMSEKLDGIRAFWDGGVSRGRSAAYVPYANTIKDDRLKTPPTATGLWSRTGKVISAPDYWLNDLPNFPLDSELWLGRNQFQSLTSIVATKDGSTAMDWDEVECRVFDSPPPHIVYSPRTITVRDYEYNITGHMPGTPRVAGCNSFHDTHEWLKEQDLGRARLHHQELLTGTQEENEKRLQQKLEHLLTVGAEGIMLRFGASYWVAQRSQNLLKFKPWHDAEATITGFTSGRETNKGSRLLGKIGALIVDFNGKRLELSGLTDAERMFSDIFEDAHATSHPGSDMPEGTSGVMFEVGDEITFKYRELSDAGIPKEARFWRKP